jgi:HEAT repeat protein
MKDKNPTITSEKKILSSSPLSGIAVPIAIILVGALIIFGVSKMLSSGKDHRDLVEELNSKTFGNRWVAAYELSKYLAASKIPEKDIPWVIDNLKSVYKQSVDARTRNFVVLALGSLNKTMALDLINQALRDPDSQVQFNAVVVLGNFPKGSEIDWGQIKKLLDESTDQGLKQALLLCIATHQHPKQIEWIHPYLSSSERMLRYSAAIALISTTSNENKTILEEILNLPYDQRDPNELNGAQVESLKLNIIDQIERHPDPKWTQLLKKIADQDTNIKINTKAQQILNLLKF